MTSRNQKVPIVTLPVDIQKYKDAAVGTDNPIATTEQSPITDLPVQMSDGDNVVEGSLADAAVAAGAAGSISAKLRRLTTDIDALLTELKLKADLTETQPVGILGYRSSDGTFQPLRLDKATNTLQTIEYEHHEIHAGSSFTCHFNNDVTNIGEQTGIAFNTPNTTKWLHIQVTAVATGAAYISIYEVADLDVDEGTDLAVYNRDRNSLTESEVSSIETAPEAGKATSYNEAQLAGSTLSTATEIMRKYIGQAGKSGIGGETRAIGEFILKQGTQYAFVITSLTADDATHNITLDWYEHQSIT